MFDKCSNSTGMCNAFGHWPTVSLGTVLFFTLSWRVYLYSSDPKYDLLELPECYSWDVFHNTRPFTTPPQTCPALSPFVAVTKTPYLIHAIPNTIMRQWNSKSGHEIRLTWFHNFTGVRGQLHVPVALHLQKEHPTLEEWDTTILGDWRWETYVPLSKISPHHWGSSQSSYWIILVQLPAGP